MRVDGELPRLDKPIAIFDAGIGSYAAVAALQRRHPRQDIVYFADRASFPYGEKSRADLLAILRRTLRFLDGFDPAAILVASNAPSVTVLDDLVDVVRSPVFGVRPPIARALALAEGGEVAVLGVKSMVESPELRAYADVEGGDRRADIHLVDASALVELVESGEFLFATDKTRAVVEAFVADLDERHPAIAALTLSSTHLPWLRAYLEDACEGRPLLDPIEDAVAAMGRKVIAGSGRVVALVTEDERYRLEDFEAMLRRLGVVLPLYVVHP